MAITTLAGAIAGEQQPVFITKIESGSSTVNLWTDLWTDAVSIGTNVTANANGSTYSSSSAQVTGQLRHIDPPSGSNSYISTFKARLSPTIPVAGGTGMVMIVDRLWQGGTYPATTTASQAITTPTFPARDINGATSGDGVVVCMVTTTNFTANTTLTLTYTNQSGTGSRTATAVMSSVGGRQALFFGLQSGDTGVQSIQSVAVSAAQAAGAYILIAVRPLAFHWLDPGSKITCDDAITLGMPRLYDGTVPQLFVAGQGSNGKLAVTYMETIG